VNKNGAARKDRAVSIPTRPGKAEKVTTMNVLNPHAFKNKTPLQLDLFGKTAADLGVSKDTVNRARNSPVSNETYPVQKPPRARNSPVSNETPETVTGRDGKQYPVQRTPKVADPLIGLAVRLPNDLCKCGSDIAVIGTGTAPHYARLQCRSCGRFRGWLSKFTADWIAGVAASFGAPETITLRGPRL
jgi:hypothetical protein